MRITVLSTLLCAFLLEALSFGELLDDLSAYLARRPCLFFPLDYHRVLTLLNVCLLFSGEDLMTTLSLSLQRTSGSVGLIFCTHELTPVLLINSLPSLPVGLG